jgi:C-terminal processing protease CtpA/Prc
LLAYRTPGASELEYVTLPPVSLDDINETPETRPATGDWVDSDLGFEILGQRGAAVMTIKTFAYYDEREKFYAFIDDAFEKIRAANVAKLLLDVRGNDGGDPFCTVHLLSYIESRPVRYFATEYRQYEKFAHPIPMAKGRFEGNLVILIDGGCYSSTGHLAAVLDYNDIGTFVGTETGGTYTCNDASKSIVLSNTRLQINMPRRTFAAAVSGMDPARGIAPDHTVAPRIQDLIEGRDTIREFALELLQ